MHVLTAIFIIAQVWGVSGIASLGNGSMKGKISVRNKVEKFCQSNPRLCKFKWAMLKDRTNDPRSSELLKITEKYGEIDANDIDRTLDEFKQQKVEKNSISCRFSAEASDLVSRTARNMSKNNDFNEKLITRNIVKLVEDLIMLPNAIIVCHNKRVNNKVETSDDLLLIQKIAKELKSDTGSMDQLNRRATTNSKEYQNDVYKGLNKLFTELNVPTQKDVLNVKKAESYSTDQTSNLSTEITNLDENEKIENALRKNNVDADVSKAKEEDILQNIMVALPHTRLAGINKKDALPKRATKTLRINNYQGHSNIDEKYMKDLLKLILEEKR